MTLVTLLLIGAICFNASADDAGCVGGAVTAVAVAAVAAFAAFAAFAAVAAVAAVADAVTQMDCRLVQ